MLSGRRLDLLDPSPVDVEIEDIAHGLARVARWNGQTHGDHAFSVAQHSLVVEAILGRLEPQFEPRWRLAALLHDAPEYVIGDMISPFKAALGLDYKDFEARLERAVHIRFGLPALTPAMVKKAIKDADRVCAYFEATQIAGFSKGEAETFFGKPPAGLHMEIAPEPPARAQAAFLKRFDVLYRSVHGEAPKSAGGRLEGATTPPDDGARQSTKKT
jgi:5'-deoxynucleotidase YfbR-like HD superfamily hydrolase